MGRGGHHEEVDDDDDDEGDGDGDDKVLMVGTATGNLWMISLHGLLIEAWVVGAMADRDLHTALLHLNPDPKAICHILSPFFTLPLASV